MNAMSADDPQCRALRAKRPAVPRMLVNVATLSRNKNFRAGARYALDAVSPLRITVAEFYRVCGRYQPSICRQ